MYRLNKLAAQNEPMQIQNSSSDFRKLQYHGSLLGKIKMIFFRYFIILKYLSLF
jgi:hypothetical protein